MAAERAAGAARDPPPAGELHPIGDWGWGGADDGAHRALPDRVVCRYPAVVRRPIGEARDGPGVADISGPGTVPAAGVLLLRACGGVAADRRSTVARGRAPIENARAVSRGRRGPRGRPR